MQKAAAGAGGSREIYSNQHGLSVSYDASNPTSFTVTQVSEVSRGFFGGLVHGLLGSSPLESKACKVIPSGRPIGEPLIADIKRIVGAFARSGAPLDIDRAEAIIRAKMEADAEAEKTVFPDWRKDPWSVNSLFDFVNLKSAGMDMGVSSSVTDPGFISTFFISMLEKTLAEGIIFSPDRREKIQALIRQYRDTYTIRTLQWACNSLPASEIPTQKERIRRFIFNRLRSEQEVLIHAGYGTATGGHGGGIRLTLVNGGKDIKGEVFSKGEGVIQYHGCYMEEGTNIRVLSKLHLEQVPLVAFENSPFLDYFTELALLKVRESVPGTKENDSCYNVGDFYEALASWPGRLIQDKEGTSWTKLQRGESCDLKAGLLPIQDVLSPDENSRFKLRMRLETLTAYLDTEEAKSLSAVPDLKWTIEEINRSVEKLTHAGKPILSAAEIARCGELTTRTQELIAEYSSSTFGNFKTNPMDFCSPANIPLVQHQPKPIGIDGGQVPVEGPKDLFLRSGRVLSAITSTSERLVQRSIAMRYLAELPDVESSLWAGEAHFSDQAVFDIFMICYCLMNTGIQGREGSLQVTSRTMIDVLNACTGILKHTEAHHRILPEYISVQAATLLKILNDSGSQVHIHHLDTGKRLSHICSELSRLNSVKGVSPREFSAFYHELFSMRTYVSLEDILRDPVARELHVRLQANPIYAHRRDDFGKSLIEVIVHLLAANPQDISEPPSKKVVEHPEYTRFRPLLFPFKEYVLQPEFVMTMLQLTYPVFIGMGISGRTKSQWDGSVTSSHLVRSNACQSGLSGVDNTVEDKIDLYPNEQYTFGVLVQEYFPPLSKEEETFVRRLLDKRMLMAEKKSRETQNDQIAVGRVPVKFGDTMVSPEEHELLLSIADNPLQCVRYFRQYPHRLSDVRFQGLLEAFLSTRRVEQHESVLGYVLRDSDSTVAETLIGFLQEQIDYAVKLGEPLRELALVRVVAQAWAQLPRESAAHPLLAAREKALKQLLERSMERLVTDDAESANVIRHWLVSLYPYVGSDHQLCDLCSSAFQSMKGPDFKEYLFEGRDGVSVDFDRGYDALNDVRMSGNSLPRWVVRSKKNVLSNPNAEVRRMPSSPGSSGVMYQCGDSTKIEVFPDKFVFVIHRKMKSLSGEDAWFVCTSSDEPLISLDESSEKPPPCEKGGYLVKDTQKWVNRELQETIVISNKNQKVLCRLAGGRVLHGENPKLSLVSDYNTLDRLVQKAFSFENKGDLLIWKDAENHLQLIDFPNYGFQLYRREEKPGEIRWYCSLREGFYLDKRFEQVDGLFAHDYFVLTNGEERIVVIPNYRLVRSKRKLEIKGIPKKKDFFTRIESSTRKYGLLIYPCEGGQIEAFKIQVPEIQVPEKPELLLYLIHVALQTRNYERAHFLTQQLALSEADWDEFCLEMTSDKWLARGMYDDKLIDWQPHARAIRIKLRLLRAEHSKEPVNVDKLQEDYLYWLDHLNSSGAYWLSPQDERDVSRLVPVPNSRIMHRMKELTGGSFIAPQENEVFVYMDREKTKIKGYFDRLGESPGLQREMVAHADQPEAIHVNLRPGRAFIVNFLHYYHLIQNRHREPEKFNALVELLRITEHDPDMLLQSLRDILLKTISVSYVMLFTTLRTAAEQGNLHIELKRLHEKFSTKEVKLPPQKGFAQKVVKIDHSLIRKSPKPYRRIERPFVAAEGVTPVDFPKSPVPRQVQWLIDYKHRCELDPNYGNQTTRDLHLAYLEALQGVAQPDLLRTLFMVRHGVKLDPALEEKAKALMLAQLEALKSIYIPDASMEPCERHSCLRTLKGIDEEIQAVGQRQGNSYKIVDFERLVNDFALEEKEARQSLELLKKEVLEIFNTWSEKLVWQRKGGRFKKTSFEELIIYFAKGDDQSILDANPSLKGQLKGLKQKIAEYLLVATECQYWERLLELSQKLRVATLADVKDPVVIDLAEKRVFAGLDSKRAYSAENRHWPIFMTIEHLLNIRLRPEQVEALENLTRDPTVDLELEAGTGFGKSTVLIFLWLILMNQRGHLTMFTVLSSLFEEHGARLKSILGKFGIAVQPVIFDRQKANDLAYVSQFNRKLELAEQYHKVLFVSIRSLHTPPLAIKETMLGSSAAIPDVARELIKIYDTFATKTFTFFDETPECLSPTVRYDFAYGPRQAITPGECARAVDFFAEVVLDPAIRAKWRFNFLTTYDPSAENPILLRDYPRLATDFAGKIIDCLGIPSESKEGIAMRDHLLGIESSDVDGYIKKMPPERQKLYQWRRRQLFIHLKNALTKKYGVNYGFDQGRIAVYYEKGGPKRGSEFVYPEDVLFLTIQANLREDMTAEMVGLYIRSLRNQWITEPGALAANPGYKLFEALREGTTVPDIGKCRSIHLETLATALNKLENLLLRLKFIELYVLPEITMCQKKLSGTSHTLMHGLAHVQGASGKERPDIMHPRIRTIEKPSEMIRNILAVARDSKVEVKPTTDSLTFLRSLVQPGSLYRVIIDPSGAFGDLPQEVIARTILEQDPALEGVSFYNADGKCMILERAGLKVIPREASILKVSSIMIFIRQMKAVGTDPLTAPNAVALVVICFDTDETAFVQGIGRMRGLQTGQRLDIAMMNQDALVISRRLDIDPKDIDSRAVLRFVKLNEAGEDGDTYFLSLQLYLEYLVEQQLFAKRSNPEEFRGVCKMLEGFLVKSTEEEALSSGLYKISKPLSAEAAVRVLQNSVLDKLRSIPGIEKHFDIREIERAFLQHVDYNKLKREVSMQSFCHVAEVEAQAENVEAFHEVESQSNAQLQTLPSPPVPPIAWEGGYRSLFEGLAIPCAGVSIYFSPNFNRICEENVDHLVRKPGYQYVVRAGQGRIDLLALDLYDAARVLEEMKTDRTKQSPEYAYYLASGGDVVASESKLSVVTKLSEVPELGGRLMIVGIIAKILGADRNLSEQEREWLHELSRRNPKLFGEVQQLVSSYVGVWPKLRPLAGEIFNCAERPGRGSVEALESKTP